MLDLKLKIPPLLLTLLFGLAMWVISESSVLIEIPVVVSLCLSFALFTLGATVLISAVVSFRFAKTTVNPLLPSESTVLVKSGVYKFSRNPMYLGFLLLLVGWGVFLSSLYSLVVPLLFVIYMDAFQIRPEEAILQEIFGEQFSVYQKQVRRWI